MGKRKKFQIVYQGRSQKKAAIAGLNFWETASIEERMQAITDMVNHAAMLKGIKYGSLRLLRSTAVIKRF